MLSPSAISGTYYSGYSAIQSVNSIYNTAGIQFLSHWVEDTEDSELVHHHFAVTISYHYYTQSKHLCSISDPEVDNVVVLLKWKIDLYVQLDANIWHQLFYDKIIHIISFDCGKDFISKILSMNFYIVSKYIYNLYNQVEMKQESVTTVLYCSIF